MEAPVNFYLSSLEEQVQSELKDDEARLSQSAVEGRVLLNVREDLLASLLDRLQEQQENVEWKQEKGLLQRQISDLKAQLDMAQVKQGQCPTSNTKHLKTKLARISSKLRQTEKDLEQQATTNKDLRSELEEVRRAKDALHKEFEAQQLELSAKRKLESKTSEAWTQQQMLTSSTDYLHAILEQMKGEKLALDRQLEAKRLEVNHHIQFIALAKTNVELELESQLKVEREQAQKNLEQHASIIKDMQAELEQVKGAKAALETEVESMRSEVSIAEQLQAAADCNTDTTKKRVEVLERDLALERGQNKKLKQRLTLKGEALQKQKEEARKTAEGSKSLELQLEKERSEKKRMAAALKKAEELLDSERARFNVEKERSRASHLAEMAKQREVSNKLTFSLKKSDQEMDLRHLQWQKEKSVLTAQLEKVQNLHSAQLELAERNHNNSMAALRSKYDQKQQSDCLQWQQEKTSLLAEAEKDRATYVCELNKEKQQNSTLVDALKKAEEQLQSQRNIWQEERAFLLQARENLNKTLQAMEQTETTMRTHIEDLEEKIAKKKRKKWYRLFGACTTTGSVPQTHMNTS